MLVYGDPSFTATARQLLGDLKRDAGRLSPDGLDELRRFLIRVGQLEQGLGDACERGAVTGEEQKCGMSLTDTAAMAFVGCWARTSGNAAKFVDLATDSSIRQIKDCCGHLTLPGAPSLSIKVPEGFEFYCLYPEQYCLAVLKWAERHSNRNRSVLVVGIRSIGTSLSAVVQAVLQAAGWRAQRLTVRPSGHPFKREAQGNWLPTNVDEFAAALVVDEGPGLSGSSMAAVAEALYARGVGEVHFFPGHNKGPGQAASAQVRLCWAETPTHFTPLSAVQWGGASLEVDLLQRSRVLVPLVPNQSSIEDVSAGGWRRFAFEGEGHWPAVCAGFERTKHLVVNQGSPALLWKFSGLGAWSVPPGEASVDRVADASGIRNPRILANFRGFSAMPWVCGKRLGLPADMAVVERAAGYVLQERTSRMTGQEQTSAFNRLVRMLVFNTEQSLEPKYAELAQELGDSVEPGPDQAYHDGHMAPEEWVITASGELWKTDNFGHDVDHTLVGRQPVLWDLAGLAVEWRLGRTSFQGLLAKSAKLVTAQQFRFYQAAYAAFRIGLATLSIPSAWDESDKQRLVRRIGRYTESLKASLSERALE